MRIIKHSSDVERNLTRVKSAVAFDVACHSVDDMGHRDTGVGVVGVVVEDRRLIDGRVHAEREETFIPVDVAREVRINTIIEQELFKGRAEMCLVGRNLCAVHGTMRHGDDPRSLCAVDTGEIIG